MIVSLFRGRERNDACTWKDGGKDIPHLQVLTLYKQPSIRTDGQPDTRTVHDAIGPVLFVCCLLVYLFIHLFIYLLID